MQRVGIIRGGVSPEYHISLQTGAEVKRALAEAGCEAIDMLLDKEGVLHIKGVPVDITEVKDHVDIVWNALHGTFGEDGQLAQILDMHGIPYVGSDPSVSAQVFNKAHTKDIARSLGINTPQSLLIMPEGGESVSEITQRIYKTMAPPWVVKPLVGGGSVRTYFAFTPLELAHFVDEAIAHTEAFLVEQYIYGKEASVGVIDRFRESDEYVLPVVEVTSPQRGILDHDKRSDRDAVYAVAGGTLRADEKERLAAHARELHKALGVKDYSQSEFIVDARGKIWFLETDTHPHLTPQSPFLVALDAVGARLQDFVKSIIERKGS